MFNVMHQQRGHSGLTTLLTAVPLDHAILVASEALCSLNGQPDPVEVKEYRDGVVLTLASTERETMYHIVPSE
jgi:hypothetical protein